MLDTVTFFRPYQRDDPEPPPSWRFTRSRAPLPEDNPAVIPGVTYEFDDKSTGYHGYGRADYVLYHTASLPRLLFQHNSRLIQSQHQIDAALTLVQAKAGELGRPPNTQDRRFLRVDLVWQFAGDPALFVLAHRTARHPRIHSGPTQYGSRSITFKGRELKILFYDKTRKQFRRDGNIVRVEIQLRGKLLKELLGDGDDVTHLDFDICYRAFRQILLGFEPAPIPQISKIAHLLAIGEREGWESAGIPCFDLYTAGESDRTVRRLRQQMALLRPEIHRINWRELLPAEGPPPPVELAAADDPEELA